MASKVAEEAMTKVASLLAKEAMTRAAKEATTSRVAAGQAAAKTPRVANLAPEAMSAHLAKEVIIDYGQRR
jgi:hypothetical protein